MPLNHVSLAVSDRERSADFYGRFFGLTERIHEDDSRLILGDAEGSVLALVEGEPRPDTRHEGVHFGFQPPDGEAVHAARAMFAAAGVAELEWQDDGKFVRVMVADPDGYRVEFFAF